jgi:hypothetical protein
VAFHQVASGVFPTPPHFTLLSLAVGKPRSLCVVRPLFEKRTALLIRNGMLSLCFMTPKTAVSTWQG